MTRAELLVPRAPDERMGGIVKLAVMAVGGQGGAVLTGWIEALARAAGYACQATSVAGVAQRTGATIYYIEMCPASERAPVFSLMPAAGDVDILIAAELMEAGRAILRGFVTPDRTVLIASDHRALAVSEKMVPGDGIARSDEVRAAAGIAARRLVLADFDGIATEAGTVISASLFGALAGADVLPFARADFEAAIRASGRGVDASLAAFGRAYEAARGEGGATPAKPGQPDPGPSGPESLMAEWGQMQAQVEALPEPVRAMALAGLRKVVDFQGPSYGAEYLSRLAAVLTMDRAERDHLLTREAAKYIAVAMCYDDVIRVADLKTRAARFDRIGTEMAAGGGRLLRLTEFMRPGAAEIVGLLPARLGAWVEARPKLMAGIGRWFGGGRRVRTDRIGAFMMLYVLGGLRRWRLGTLRHAHEMAHLKRWLGLALSYLPENYDLAVEILRCRRLVKGYSDTHARGLSKFDLVVGGIALVKGRADAPDWARRLRDAALLDEEGSALDGALATVRSFV